MSEGKKPPVNFELGASAKAELKAEIKTEIPSESSGRFLDAITDIIRPFSESRGLKADNIRLQREEVLIVIAQKARERLRLEGKRPEEVPTRILVPLLEKASLSDAQDKTLVDAWSNILASASTDRNHNHGLFVDVLGKLEAPHLKFLEHLAEQSSSDQKSDGFLFIGIREIQEFIDTAMEEFGTPSIAKLDAAADQFGAKLRDYVSVPGSALVAGGMAIDLPNNTTSYFEFPESVDRSNFPQSVTEALEAVNLVRRYSFPEPSGSTFRPWAEVIQFTIFGFEFYNAAHMGKNVWEE